MIAGELHLYSSTQIQETTAASKEHQKHPKPLPKEKQTSRLYHENQEKQAEEEEQQYLNELQQEGEVVYDVLPNAFYSLKTGLSCIKVRLANKYNNECINRDNNNEYMVISNMFANGAHMENTLTKGILTVAVRNWNQQPVVLDRDIPIARAVKLNKERSVAYLTPPGTEKKHIHR